MPLIDTASARPLKFGEGVPTRASRLRSTAGRVLRAAAAAAGQDLVKRQYYSPIPRVEGLPDEFFSNPSLLPGIDFDTTRQLEYLRSHETWLAELHPPPGFFDNIMYKPLETELLYATIRRREPSRVIELGSGFTTLVIAEAMRENAEAGKPGEYLVYDPYPRSFVRAGVSGVSELRAVSAADAPVEDFAALREGDVLFVDSTHTVKQGSEVNHLILDVLPTLAAGVCIHFHDIFLPYEYPRPYAEAGLYFAEQYLLQAFLALNPSYRVLFGSHAIAKTHAAEVSEMVPSFSSESDPTAFWIARV